MPFSLPGNAPIQQALYRLIEKETLPHALLFTGAQGACQARFATAFAKIALKTQRDNHPDIHHYQSDGVHTIESIRQLSKQAFEAPFEAPMQFLILHDAHRMLPPAANALLKTLEEPLPSTHLILISTKSDELLPTIQSRLMKLYFKPLTPEEIATELITQKVPEDKASQIALLSQGSLDRAHQLLDQELPVDQIYNLCLYGLMRDYPNFKKALESLGKNLSPQDAFECIQLFFRDFHLLQVDSASEYLFYKEQIKPEHHQLCEHIPSLEVFNCQLLKAQQAHESGTRLSTALHTLFTM